MSKHYLIKTYGCQMNVHESEKLAGMLISLGYTETESEENADIIIFNTCSIRDGCEQKVFGNVGSLKHLKKQNPNLIIAMCGCITQIPGRAELIKQKYPYVSIVFGTHNLYEFKKYLMEYQTNKTNVVNVWHNDKEVYPIVENTDMYRTSDYNAWVNIMYGCNNFCSYCIVPYVRGRERSRDLEDIVSEVTDLIKQGYKTITLLGQNVNSYGNDLHDSNITFSKLLQRLNDLEGDFRIKFMTSHPKDLNDEVITTIANGKKLAKVIHLPVQSGNNDILKQMNRHYTIEHYMELIQSIRSHMPLCYISTDIIVGFPGETDEQFMDTYNLVKQVRYDGVFAFMFSPRTGTLAEKMQNQIDLNTKRSRINKLLSLSKKITSEKNSELIGKVMEVLIEHKNETGNYSAVTLSGKSVEVEYNDTIKENTFYNILFESFSQNKLKGKIV